MNAARFLILVVALLALAALPGAAAPLAGPCVPGAAYDPACDADRDGDVDIFDIQLTAGHWNQAGTYVGDNNHTHLGQTWTGNSNPLSLTGSYGAPGYAPLVLSNSAGYGLQVQSALYAGVHVGSAGTDGFALNSAEYNGVVVSSAGEHGVYVGMAGYDGVYVNSAVYAGVGVNSAGNDGVYVGLAGSPSAYTLSTLKNGYEVAGAQGNGLYVGRADDQGVVVNSTGGNGIGINAAGHDGVSIVLAGNDGVIVSLAGTPSTLIYSPQKNGFEVAGAQGDGLYVGRADVTGVAVNSVGNTGLYVGESPHYGVDVPGGDWAGYFWGSIYVRNGCFGCLQANFGVNAGDRPLQPGDVVSIEAVTPSDLDTAPVLWQVVPAQLGQAVVGVVAGRAEVAIHEEHRPTETGKRLVPREGAAQSGEYVTIVYSGPMQVRVAPDASAITAGTRLTAAAGGQVRPLQTRTVDGMVVTEGTPVIGTALEPLADGEGMIWVLVNPQ